MNQRYLIGRSAGKGQSCHSSCLSSNDGFSCIVAQHACTHRYMQYLVPRGLDQAFFLPSLLLQRCKASALAKGSLFLATLNRHMHICSSIHTCEHISHSRHLFLLIVFLPVPALQSFFVLLADLCIGQSVTDSKCPNCSLRYLQSTLQVIADSTSSHERAR